MKRIGLDARLTRQMSVGMKAYTRELAARLPHVAPEFAYVPFSNGANFGWDEQVTLPLAMRRAHLDLVHFLSLYTPVAPPRPYVVTIHDLIHLRFPQYFKAKVAPYYRTVVRWVATRASCVITDDERTVGDLHRFLGVALRRVRIVPLGVGGRFLAPIEPYRAPRPYALYAGNHRQHKDLPTLFEAWAGLSDAHAIDLYVTGADDFGSMLARYQRGDRRIVILGDVSEEQLAAYYAGARAFVLPSLCEGFGLPVLEAMAAGCPVIACSDAVPAVARRAALTFAPRDVAGLRAQLDGVLANEGLRTALVNQGRALAETLTWDRCARATADVYREMMEEHVG